MEASTYRAALLERSRQRRTLRQVLTLQGFERTAYSSDEGDGIYTEVWTHPELATVHVHWTPRAPFQHQHEEVEEP